MFYRAPPQLSDLRICFIAYSRPAITLDGKSRGGQTQRKMCSVTMEPFEIPKKLRAGEVTRIANHDTAALPPPPRPRTMVSLE